MAGTFDFTQTFDKIGKLFTKRFRRSFETQVDLEGRAFAMPAPATLEARARLIFGTTSGSRAKLFKALGVQPGKTLKGKAWAKNSKGPKSVPLTRLYVTHDLALRGFAHQARKEDLRLFVTDHSHIPFYGSQPRLSDIIRWNSKGQPSLNPRVGAKAPLVWPVTPRHVEMIEPEYKWAFQLLERDAARQMKDKLKLQARVTLQL